MSKLIGEVIKRLFSRPVTIEYPFAKTSVEKDIRGRHYADLSKCIGCSLCMIECPADAIKMEKIPDEYKVPEKNRRRLYPRIDYGKCIYCYRCVTVCPVNAYITTDDYHLSGPSIPDSSKYSLATLEKSGG